MPGSSPARRLGRRPRAAGRDPDRRTRSSTTWSRTGCRRRRRSRRATGVAHTRCAGCSTIRRCRRACATATRRDRGTVDTSHDGYRYVVDFEGETLRALDDASALRAVVSAGNGAKVWDEHVYRNRSPAASRLVFPDQAEGREAGRAARVPKAADGNVPSETNPRLAGLTRGSAGRRRERRKGDCEPRRRRRTAARRDGATDRMPYHPTTPSGRQPRRTEAAVLARVLRRAVATAWRCPRRAPAPSSAPVRQVPTSSLAQPGQRERVRRRPRRSELEVAAEVGDDDANREPHRGDEASVEQRDEEAVAASSRRACRPARDVGTCSADASRSARRMELAHREIPAGAGASTRGGSGSIGTSKSLSRRYRRALQRLDGERARTCLTQRRADLMEPVHTVAGPDYGRAPLRRCGAADGSDRSAFRNSADSGGAIVRCSRPSRGRGISCLDAERGPRVARSLDSAMRVW